MTTTIHRGDFVAWLRGRRAVGAVRGGRGVSVRTKWASVAPTAILCSILYAQVNVRFVMPHHKLAVAVHELRTQQGWSLRELGRQSGLSASTLSRVENGKELTFSAVEALAKAFDMTIVDFLITAGYQATIDEDAAQWIAVDARARCVFEQALAELERGS